MGQDKRFVIGLDYGSNSVRCLVMDAAEGSEYGVSVWDYPSGDAGVLSDPQDPHVARQNPADFVEGLAGSIIPALEQAEKQGDFSRDRVIGIGVDTTGSTPLPLDSQMVPLATQDAYKDNLNAQAWMWKDHSSMSEAERITELAREHRPQFLNKCGGAYSSEWFWSKIWHCLNVDPDVFNAAYSWIEIADFIPAVLVGAERPEEVRRSVCAAGHKAMYCQEWDGLPDEEFLKMLDSSIAELRQRLYNEAFCVDTPAGYLCSKYAEKLGLPEGIAVAVGAFDAHLGAIGAGVREGHMVKILGTSTCDITVAPSEKQVADIPGVCGIVDGSVLPRHYGIEAGQSAVGDIFNWFVQNLCGGDEDMLASLTDEAAALKPGESGLLALDWNNGNRTVLVDARLSGLLIGQTLQTTRPEILRALIEATAFGARRILDRMEEYGVEVEEVINCGGIAEKNPLLMQIYADVLGRNMVISGSSETCALGSAMAASVAAGADAGGYDDIQDAQKAVCSYKDTVYTPIQENSKTYELLYRLYCELHDSFGVSGTSFDHYEVMKKLMEISRSVKHGANI